MVDQQCRGSKGKVKIEGYMSVSDEEAHQCKSHLIIAQYHVMDLVIAVMYQRWKVARYGVT